MWTAHRGPLRARNFAHNYIIYIAPETAGLNGNEVNATCPQGRSMPVISILSSEADEMELTGRPSHREIGLSSRLLLGNLFSLAVSDSFQYIICCKGPSVNTEAKSA